MEHDDLNTAETTINRQRFHRLVEALERGKNAPGVCAVHGITSDCQILLLEASEAVLVDSKNAAYRMEQLRRETQSAISIATAAATSAAASAKTISECMAKIEFDQADGKASMVKAAKGLSAAALFWLCVFGAEVAYIVKEIKG